MVSFLQYFADSATSHFIKAHCISFNWLFVCFDGISIRNDTQHVTLLSFQSSAEVL